jgi:hypothetical protein
LRRELEAAPTTVHCGSCEYEEGDTMRVTVGYRNFSDQAREFPGLAFVDSVLYVDPRVSLLFLDAPCFVIEPRPGRLVTADSLPPLRVEPMSESSVTFDLSAVYPMRGRSFILKMEVDGHGMAMSRSILKRRVRGDVLLPN